ncbi:MAG: hypothetical protein CL599_08970 [Alteromonas sp.]|nr:hypothetical protein [Alteromonas sp.]OUX87552.1 MAG: hypothetical protein CBB95_08830 [Alteromonas sp. TMED35]|tara:strand:- start:1097 stop:1390 length:294 start_codon:yes stop_codon:yes gene_type:complete
MKTAGQLAAKLTRFHVHAPTFSTAITATDNTPNIDHSRKHNTYPYVLQTTFKEVFQRKSSLIHHRGAPLAQLARAFGWFGRAGLQGGCDFVVSAGGF